MKSYLRFLSRNKLYTAIEIIGLSIALGFIIILSAYVIDEFSTDPQVKNKSKLWVCHNKGIATSSQKFDKIFDATPEILDYCQFTDSEAPIYIKANDLSYSEKPLYVSSNFFLIIKIDNIFAYNIELILNTIFCNFKRGFIVN